MTDLLYKLDLPPEAKQALADAGPDCPQETADAISVLQRAPQLQATYAAHGWPDELYEAFLTDFASKVRECHARRGIWGTCIPSWHERCFALKIFTLGRLQFEAGVWDLADQPPYVKAGDAVQRCHISSVGPLRPEDVLDSFRRAYAFFGSPETLVIECKSWLLHPPHFPLFPEGSNTGAFHEFFEILESHKRGTRDLWRVFGVEELTDPALLPQDTRLQRNFAAWLAEGNEMGTGFGYVVLRDGAPIFPVREISCK